MITRSKRNYIDFLCDHKDDGDKPCPPPSEEVLRVQAESQAKRHKSILWEAAESKGDKEEPTASAEEAKSLHAWKQYARVLEHIAEKEIEDRALCIFQKKMKEDEGFMKRARETFSAQKKGDEVSARAKSQLFSRHVHTMAQGLFRESQDTQVTRIKDKCFEKTMKLFALEAGLTNL